MRNLLTLMKQAPKRTSALAAMIAVAIIAPLAVQAWGPHRETFTLENPADHVVFNSITNNPNIRDERNFVGIRESGTNNLWSDSMEAQPGKEYTVRMYVHNNAASSLNLKAKDVTAKFNLPTTTAKEIQVNGFLSASNVGANANGNPGAFSEVYDHATFKSGKDFNLAYTAGSLKYENNAFGAAGTALPESIFTSAGAKLGYDSLNGEIPGCFQYAGYVTFKVKAQFAPEPAANFTVSKQVKKAAETKFSESVNAKAGEALKYRITVANSGDATLNNVNLKDQLPKGISYTPGTVKILNANNPAGALIANGDKMFSTGVNIGHYTGGGSNAIIAYDATVDANDKLPLCGTNTLTNKAIAQPEGHGPKEDTANVVVPKECKPVVKYTCDNLAIQTLSRTQYRFTTNYTVENATFKSVTYTVRNASGAVVDTKTATTNTYNYTQTTAGKYTVQAAVTFTVDGQDKTVTSNGCKGEFEVPALPNKITVCELETKTIITIDEKDYNESIHSKDLSKCKDTPVTPPTTPETPPELPQTGVTENSIAIVGLGALIASIAYFVASRRALNL